MKSINCVVVGDSGVGKTCLLIRYTTNEFPKVGAYLPAICVLGCGVDVIHRDRSINLTLIDTYADNDLGIARAWDYKKADVVLICMNLLQYGGDEERYWRGWYPEVRHYCQKVPIVLVGMKCDLRLNPPRELSAFSIAEMRNFARRIGAYGYIECSALTGENVSGVFHLAISAVVVPFYNSLKDKREIFVTVLKSKLQQSPRDPFARPAKLGMVAKTYESNIKKTFICGHSAIYISPKMYVFCGYGEGFKDLKNSTQIWSGENGYACEEIINPESFAPTVFHTTTLFLGGKVVTSPTSQKRTIKVPQALIFGGMRQSYLAGVHVFDPATKQFTLLETRGKRPSPRYGMTSVTYNNNVYVFGGYDSSLCNDLFMLDTETKEWLTIEIQGTPPTPRMFHTAVCFENIMVIYGGSGVQGTDTVLHDMYLIDLDTGVSSKCDAAKSPGPRQQHACFALNKDEMVLIGGVTTDYSLSNDVFIFSLSAKQWIKVNVTGEFAKREMHKAIFTGSEIWVYGGKGEKDNPALFTKLFPNFITFRFFEVLPKFLTLFVLSFLTIGELSCFGQVCHATHEFAEDHSLWIRLCQQKDPTYKYIPNGKEANGQVTTPKKYLENYLMSFWLNPFDTVLEPCPVWTHKL